MLSASGKRSGHSLNVNVTSPSLRSPAAPTSRRQPGTSGGVAVSPSLEPMSASRRIHFPPPIFDEDDEDEDPMEEPSQHPPPPPPSAISSEHRRANFAEDVTSPRRGGVPEPLLAGGSSQLSSADFEVSRLRQEAESREALVQTLRKQVGVRVAGVAASPVYRACRPMPEPATQSVP